VLEASIAATSSNITRFYVQPVLLSSSSVNEHLHLFVSFSTNKNNVSASQMAIGISLKKGLFTQGNELTWKSPGEVNFHGLISK
jgi:hypothetical protein